MNQDRINKIIAIAQNERGDKGVRDNARRKLDEMGVSWKKTFVQQVKEVFTGKEEVKRWQIAFENPADLLLISWLSKHCVKNSKSIVINSIELKIKIFATESEMLKIQVLYNKHKAAFDDYIRTCAATFLTGKI